MDDIEVKYIEEYGFTIIRYSDDYFAIFRGKQSTATAEPDNAWGFFLSCGNERYVLITHLYLGIQGVYSFTLPELKGDNGECVNTCVSMMKGVL